MVGLVALVTSGPTECKVPASLEKSWSSALKQIRRRMIGDFLDEVPLPSKDELTINEDVLYLYRKLCELNNEYV